MSDDAGALRADVATASRAFAQLGFVHGFGHVSVRLPHSLLITPTRPPLATQQATDILEVDFEGRVLSGVASARPIEAYLHIEVYRSRSDVAAICRTHAPAASVWRYDKKAPAVLHGFGGIVSDIRFHEGSDLVHNAEIGAAAARNLGGADALVLRGNGVMTVGASLTDAAAKMWSLEERYAAALRHPPQATPFSDAELAARRRWYPAESERVWAWLRHLGGESAGLRE